MYEIFTTIDDINFQISTNSFYLYEILKMEIAHNDNHLDVSKRIIIEYISTDILYAQYIGQATLQAANFPVCIIDTNISKMIICSLEDVYSVRAFITREILKYLYATGKFLALHASAILTAKNEAVLFSGEKNAGKSSLSMAAVLHGNSKLITDDIAILYKKGKSVIVEGIFKGINADENTSTTFKTGMQKNSTQPAIKDRYIVLDSLHKKYASITAIFFPSVSKRIDVVKTKKDSLKFNLTMT